MIYDLKKILFLKEFRNFMKTFLNLFFKIKKVNY